MRGRPKDIGIRFDAVMMQQNLLEGMMSNPWSTRDVRDLMLVFALCLSKLTSNNRTGLPWKDIPDARRREVTNVA